MDTTLILFDVILVNYGMIFHGDDIGRLRATNTVVVFSRVPIFMVAGNLCCPENQLCHVAGSITHMLSTRMSHLLMPHHLSRLTSVNEYSAWELTGPIQWHVMSRHVDRRLE